jgi:putative endonuclease
MTDGGKEDVSWFVYILFCSDGTLYTGITTDIERRLREHNTGKAGARYTRSRRPVRLAYREVAASRSEAARREYQIRRMPVAGKRALAAKGGISKKNWRSSV